MQDRVSTYPGRITLTPVTGESNTYDWARADDPSVVGTPLNKATFLPDDVASAIAALTGETINLPSDALSALCTALDTMGLLYNGKISAFSYVGTGGSSTQTTTFSIHPRIVFYIRNNSYIGTNRQIYTSSSENTSTVPWQIWVYNSTGGAFCTFSYSEANKQLSRAFSGNAALTYSTATKAEALMNSSGVTYYCVAIGVK